MKQAVPRSSRPAFPARLELLVWPLILAALYTAARILGDASPLLMPPLSSIFKALISDLANGKLLIQSASSVGMILLAMAVSTLLGFGLTLLSRLRLGGGFQPGRGLVNSLTSIFHPLPGIALLPLIILWLGTGTAAVFFILVHSILWPLTTNLAAGFDAIPGIYYQIGRNYQLSRFQVFRSIELPGAYSMLRAGWRIGWARGWRALISAEMVFGSLGGSGGLGWYLFQKRVFMDSPGIFAGLIVIIAIGLLVEGLLGEKS